VTGRERLLAAFSPELVAALENLVDERVQERLSIQDGHGPAPPWLSVLEAAELLRCKRQRVDDLLSQGRLARYKDGSRTLLRRAEVDAYIRRHCL
jgi:excisionase family DNA binding protein